MVAGVVFAVSLVWNVIPSTQEAKLQFHREVEFGVVVTEKIKVRVGGKKQIELFTDKPEIYSFQSANKKIATVNKKRVG